MYQVFQQFATKYKRSFKAAWFKSKVCIKWNYDETSFNYTVIASVIVVLKLIVKFSANPATRTVLGRLPGRSARWFKSRPPAISTSLLSPSTDRCTVLPLSPHFHPCVSPPIFLTWARITAIVLRGNEE